MAKKDLIVPSEILRVGQRVEISLANDKEEIFYTSRVEDFNTEHLVIAMPMDKGYPIIPHQSEVVYGRLRANESLYKFTSVFIGKAARPIPILQLAMPKKLEKHQQREFVRVDARFSLKVSIEDTEKNLLPPIETFTKDISGGGLSFIMNQELLMGSRVHIETELLPNVGALQLVCEVVRSIRPIATENIFWIGVKFFDLPKIVERDLIRFIFQKQRELLSKRNFN